jgi:hypothetical protein
MPEPTLKDWHVNVPLSNLTIGWYQEESAFVAMKAFPIVPSDKQSDSFFEFAIADQLRSEARKRAPLTESTGTGFALTTTSFTIEEYADHYDVPWSVLKNQDLAVDAVSVGTTDVRYKTLLAVEIDFWANFVKGSVWTTTKTGVAATPSTNQFLYWDDPDSDPIGDMSKWILEVMALTGKAPNTLVIGKKIFEALRIHPDLVDIYKYTQTGILNLQQVSAALGVENILVSSAVVNTAEKGIAAAISFVSGRNGLLLYLPPTYGKMIPSAGYTFMWSPYGYQIAMSQFEMPQVKGDRIESSLWITQQKIAADLGVYIPSAISTGVLS